MFYTTPVLVFPSNTVIAQYKTYYEQNGYVTNIFINLSLRHISNRGMARRLPNSSQVSERNQRHDNAVRAAHARELHSTLAEESPARIHQLLEPVPRSFHRKLQIHIHATSLARRTAGMHTRNEGDPASIHPAMDDTQEFSGRHLGRKCDRRVQ